MTTGIHHRATGRSTAAQGARRALAAALVTALWATLGTVVAASPASAADEVHAVPVSRTWQVEGRGWGHGIGMSQWGAQGAAVRGLSAEQILDFYYPGTVRFDIGQDYPLRVRLLSLAGATMTAGPTAGAALVVTDVATGQAQTAPVGARVEVRRTAAGFTAVVNGSALVIDGRTTVTGPVAVAGSGGTEVWAYAADGSGVRYSGSLRAASTGPSTLEVVNHVPMEQYLRGVVPRESPASWAPAALQAQAVAARSYALSVRAPAGTADLCDTTQCQVYGGNAGVSRAGVVTERRHPNTDAAIAATARITRYYGGAPAFTQFSSSNGGHSRVGSRPYLVAKPDPYTGTAPGDSVSRWTATLSADRVQTSCPSGGTLQRMSLRRDGNGDLGGRITSATLVCSTGTATVQTPAFGLLSSWWRPSGTGNPFGNLEVVEGSTGGVTVAGWAIDPDASAPVDLRVTVAGTASRVPAARNRPDVGAAFPAYGPRHGFERTLPAPAGTTRVCVDVVNVGAGADTPWGCRDVTVAAGAPFGSVETVAGRPGSGGGGPGIRVSGWVVDADAPTTPVGVEAWVDDAVAARATADRPRPDVGAALPGYGDRHGYTVDVPAASGDHELCLVAVNRPAGRNPALACRVVTVPEGPPVGNVEVLRGVPGGVQVRGWALDPGTSDPVYVWVDTSGTGRPLRADVARPDVAAAYPGYGAAHGFDAVVPAAPGPVRVCVTAVNTGTGSDVGLRCSTVTVPDASPVGYVDNLLGGLGSIELRGWALDPETPAPVYVWVDVSGAGRPVLASVPRPDIAAAYPGAGPDHGFDLDIPAPAGTHIVCVTAVNRGAGSDQPLTCKTVTVADPSPTGQVDGVAGVPGGIQVSGWALDPETPAPTYVWLDVAGAGRPVLADGMRRDVGLAFPTLGPRHGFDVRVAAPPGRHLVCATAVNVGRGTDRPLGCRPVTVPVA